VVVASLKVLSQHLPRGTEENTKNLSPNGRYPGRDSNTRPPEDEAVDHDVWKDDFCAFILTKDCLFDSRKTLMNAQQCN
jgi:hypothetical protein